MAAPTITDLDGDDQLELILSLKDTLRNRQEVKDSQTPFLRSFVTPDGSSISRRFLSGSLGGVQIWDLPGSSGNCTPWPTARGGMLRQGRTA